MDPLEWIDRLFGATPWGTALIWVAAVIVVLYFGGRMIAKAWKPLTRFVQTINSLADLPAFMARTDSAIVKQNAQLDGIYHETHRNDGSSIKDSTVRLEQSVEGLHGRLDSMQEKLTKDHARISAIEDTLPKDQLPKGDA
ncbi:hypothetical protein [Humibacter ginsenosidimutans]|uniref:DUF2746 domain-containing protein n=1 Tax=Humibacter ginsenosidimutans TaxID=2599293 RepID=A0A5B8M6M6_9MICO|nr:hypothetical protein [Humibacter ginsenosidimutans]QDZ15769.1 hypothetical protein FPZ11_14265 [Humibacter ginsenosidimutans]